MGKKGWFSTLKKVLSSEPKEKKDQKTSKSKKKWFAKHKSADLVTLSEEISVAVPAPCQSIEEKKYVEEVNELSKQSKHAYTVALASAAAAQAAVAAAQAAAEVVRLTTMSRYSGKSKEEIAAIKIQTAFRGYLARRALRALRGLVRLKALIEGQSVKRQAASTLKCMQNLARLQSQIRERRIRMSEENQALQRHLQLKHEKELEELRMAEVWDDSVQSKEQIEANLQNKQEAAMRRERALAYAFSHQTRRNSRSPNPTFMDPNNPHWGWSWLERWMAARPWEPRNMTDKSFNDHSSIKTTMSTRSLPVTRESNKASAHRDLNSESKPSPTGQRLSRPQSRQSPSSPSKPASSTPTLSRKQGSPKVNACAADEDSKSSISIRSEMYKRHSIAGSSVRDDESLASSPAVPSYMAPTRSQSAKSKSKVPSPGKDGTPEKGSAGSVKKQLSFSPASQRRHSVPGKIESIPMKDGDVHLEDEAISNGGRSSGKGRQI